MHRQGKKMPSFEDLWSRMKRELVELRVTENYINTFERELKFLRTFLNYTAIRCFEFQNLEDLKMRAEAVEPRAEKDLTSLIDHSVEERAARFIDVAAHVVDEVKHMRSEIREVYWIVSRESQFHYFMTDELVINFIDSLLENLENLVSFNLVDPLKIKLEALKGKLRLLRTFLMFTRKRCAEHEKVNDLFIHAKFVADNAAYLCYSCLVDEMDEEMLDRLLVDFSDLLQKINPVIPEGRPIFIGVLEAYSKPSPPDLFPLDMDEIAVEFVESLLKNVMELRCVGLTVPLEDQVEILQAELAFLRDTLVDPPNHHTESEALGYLLKHSKALSTKAALVVYSLFDNKVNEETTKKLYFSLADLLEEIKLFKVEIYIKSPFPKLPKTYPLGFLDSLLSNLRQLLNRSSNDITSLDLPVESLLEELQFLRYFLKTISMQYAMQEKLRVLWTQVVDVAYKTEYTIDSLLVGNGPKWHLMLLLSEIRKEIEVVTAEINKIDEKKIYDSEVHFGAEMLSQASSEFTSPEMDDVEVGFKDEEESLIEDLLRGPTKLMMVSIVGMPGLGKTHLAKRIYNNPIVKLYFDVCAWCYVSQAYNREYLLTHIVNQVVDHEESMSMDEEVAQTLYRNLKGKRFFILIDDMWDVEAWDVLRRSFPDDKNGSRIMFTSRFHNLNLKTSARKVHHLRPFSNDESWQLLQAKLFQRESCPSELLEVGKEIAKNCNGLPLAVVVITGILARIDMRQNQWREVADSQSSHIVDNPKNKSMDIIELSYNHLPDYLKPCFLYIGAFLNKKYIPVRKLIYLWVAEGFIQKVKHKSLEDVAEDYLMDLIDRSLVIVAERGSKGGIKKCQVHDLIRDFCMKRAKEDNFLQQIEQFHTSDYSRHIIYGQRRICSSQPTSFLNSQVYCRQVRSLLFVDCDLVSAEDCNVSSIFDKFKLLKVLDLGYIWFNRTFPDGMNSLRHLTYLAICGDFDSIPSSIANLQNLETFIVVRSLHQVHLPHSIWDMVKLRHLHISERAVLSRASYNHISQLDSLQTVSTLVLSYGDYVDGLLEGFSKIKQMRCIFLDSLHFSPNSFQFPVLDTLSQLESLRVSYGGKARAPFEISFPSNIKKLTLSEFRFLWNQISIIGMLPNLEVLKLLDKAFQGKEWEMRNGEFPKLKFLKLKNMNLRKWSISDDYFPPLERVVLHFCWWLEEIPPCLGEIPTLNMIEVRWCSNSLAQCVEQIQEEQLDLGNQDLKVLVEDLLTKEDSWIH